MSGTASGIVVEGPQALVANNVIDTGHAGGNAVPIGPSLSVSGADPIVRGNRLKSHGPAIVSCAPCSAGEMSDNSSLGTYGDVAFRVSARGPRFIVRNNQVTAAGRAGFQFDGGNVFATNNSVTDSGVQNFGYGFIVHSTVDGTPTLSHNTARGCTDSGFRILASGVTLDGNVSLGSGLNGFSIARNDEGLETTGVVLRNNRAVDSAAAGFALFDGAVATILTGNEGVANRYDLCDDGTGTDLSGGNRFPVVSTVCDVARY